MDGTRLLRKPRHRRQDNIKGEECDGFWNMGFAKETREHDDEPSDYIVT
jgi:hypothetical protein